jgi:hypothetical protein
MMGREVGDSDADRCGCVACRATTSSPDGVRDAPTATETTWSRLMRTNADDRRESKTATSATSR